MSKIWILLLCSSVSLASFSTKSFADCTEGWKSNLPTSHCEMVPITFRVSNIANKQFRFNRKVTVNIRAGYLEESRKNPFKGNIIFFEGLGDSMLNHAPLFNRLTEAGYRVIAFDYMGQGGSTGKMDDTRIHDIITIGDQIWSRYARQPQSPKIILGWSTGGLAAYEAAFLRRADQVILIAPGIVANVVVGEQQPRSFSFDAITVRTLTRDTYNADNSDPHVDPIKPSSPIIVPNFALNL